MPYKRRDELSEKQSELLVHLIEHIEQYGYQPSMTEAGEHFGITTKAIRDRLLQLARKGFVELPPRHFDRSLRLRYVRFKAHFDKDFNKPRSA